MSRNSQKMIWVFRCQTSRPKVVPIGLWQLDFGCQDMHVCQMERPSNARQRVCFSQPHTSCPIKICLSQSPFPGSVLCVADKPF